MTHSESAHLRTAALGELQHEWVIRIDDRPVGVLLVLENPRLGFAVRFDAGVPIEVIGREVQHDGHPRMKGDDLLELKAARLDDMKHLWRRVRDLRTERRTDVSSHTDFES